MPGWSSSAPRPRRSAPWARRSSPRPACARPGCRCCRDTTASSRTSSTRTRGARRRDCPLIIKPAAGGGGKGMQIVRTPAELAPALAAARRLAAQRLRRRCAAHRALSCRRRGTSRSRCSPIRTATSCIWAIATAPCSAATRSSSRRRLRPSMPAEVRERLRAAALVVAREIGYVSRRHGRVSVRRDASSISWK